MGTILGMLGLEKFNQEFAQALVDAEDDAIMATRDLPGLRLGSFNDYNCTGPTITLPACIGREDVERIMAEIQAVLDWAGLRGERQRTALARIAACPTRPALSSAARAAGTVVVHR